MRIPAIPLRIRKGIAVSPDVTFGASVIIPGGNGDYDDIMKKVTDVCGKGSPVLVIDADGIRKADIFPNVLKRLPAGRETWFMTGIRNAGDMIDAFHGNIGKLVVPYHLTADDALIEMSELSDCLIPALFIDSGGVHIRGRRKRGTADVLRTLEGMNFSDVAVFDASGGRIDIMYELRGKENIAVPYINPGTDDGAADASDRGFAKVIVPYQSVL